MARGGGLCPVGGGEGLGDTLEQRRKTGQGILWPHVTPSSVGLTGPGESGVSQEGGPEQHRTVLGSPG